MDDSSTRHGRLRAPPGLEPDGEKPQGKRYALVIGIDDYNTQYHGALFHAVKDATAIADKLRDDFGFDVMSLLNQCADARAIREILERWETETKPEDSVLIFFAGHGANHPDVDRHKEGYLLPAEADDDPKSWLAESEIIQAVKRLPARRLLLLFDACYAGSTLDQEVPVGEVEDQVLMALVAGTAHQPVLDGGAGEHSIFTRAILDGLDGWADVGQRTDDVISAAELIAYVKSEVPWRSRLRRHEQTPIGGALQRSGRARDFQLRPVVPRLKAPLLRNIYSQAAEDRKAAAQQLGKRAPGDTDEVVRIKARELTRLVCDDGVLDVRVAAAKGLGELGHPDGYDILDALVRWDAGRQRELCAVAASAADAENRELRAAAASALGELAHRAQDTDSCDASACRQKAIGALVDALNTTNDQEVLEQVKRGLAMIPVSSSQLAAALASARQPKKQILDALACLAKSHPSNEQAWPALSAIDCRLLRRFYLARRRLRPQMLDMVRQTIVLGLLGAVGLFLVYLLMIIVARPAHIKLYAFAALSVTALPGVLTGMSLATVPRLALSVTRRQGSTMTAIGGITAGLFLSLWMAFPNWFFDIGCGVKGWLLPGLVVGPTLGLVLVSLPWKGVPLARQEAERSAQLANVRRGNLAFVVTAAVVGAFGFAVSRIPMTLSFGDVEPHLYEVLMWGVGGAVFGAALAAGWYISLSVGRLPPIALQDSAQLLSNVENV